MFKYRGNTLARLVRAICEKSPDANGKPYTYELEIYPSVGDGNSKQEFRSVAYVNRSFGKSFRMDPDLHQHAVLRNGKWVSISESEYGVLLAEYKSVG